MQFKKRRKRILTYKSLFHSFTTRSGYNQDTLPPHNRYPKKSLSPEQVGSQLWCSEDGKDGEWGQQHSHVPAALTHTHTHTRTHSHILINTHSAVWTRNQYHHQTPSLVHTTMTQEPLLVSHHPDITSQKGAFTKHIPCAQTWSQPPRDAKALNLLVLLYRDQCTPEVAMAPCQ